MQESDGSMRLMDEEEVKSLSDLQVNQKVIKEGMYFKIKRCYFRLMKISPEGIEAKGVTRREYFDNR